MPETVATIGSPQHSLSRIGPAAAYLNSLLKDAFDCGCTIIIRESHQYPHAVGGSTRALPRLFVDLYQPGETIATHAPEPEPALPPGLDLEQLIAKAAAYDRINTPELYEFVSAVMNEALHQRERWCDADAAKEDGEWFWLVGYLASKAFLNPSKDEMSSGDARLHRIITVAAAAANWHASVLKSLGLDATKVA